MKFYLQARQKYLEINRQDHLLLPSSIKIERDNFAVASRQQNYPSRFYFKMQDRGFNANIDGIFWMILDAKLRFSAFLNRGVYCLIISTGLALILTSLVISFSPALSQSLPANLVETEGAPVILNNEVLFRIDARIGSFTPDLRAQIISERLQSLGEDFETDFEDLAIRNNETTNTTDIVLGEMVLVTLSDADAAAVGHTRRWLADQYLVVIQQGLERYRETYQIQSIAFGMVYTILATIAFLLALRLMNQGIAKTIHFLRAHQDDRIPSLKILRNEIISATRMVDFFSEILKFIQFTLVITLFSIYLNLVLSFFPWTRELADSLFRYILLTLSVVIENILNYLPNLFVIVLIVGITSYVLKFIKFFFAEIGRGRIQFQGFYREWARPTYNIVRFLILTLAASIIFPYLPGAGTPAFQGISIFLGVLVSLGSSSVVANVVSGVVLTYTRAFEVGDRVQIADTTGDVIGKNLLVTRICTIKHVIITIPNAQVLGGHIINFSATERDPKVPPLILHTTVTLGYDVPWRKVHETLIAAANATPELLSEPLPFVLQTSLDDYYVSYELNAYTRNPGIMARIYSDLHQNIQDFCNQAGIEILSPGYHAVRDGNTSTIPADYLPSNYVPPGFRVEANGSGEEASGG